MRINHRALLILAAMLVGSVLAVVAPADALTVTAPSGLRNCPTSSATISSACLSGALSDFNRARAKEGLGHLILPTNFRALNVRQQLLVLTNLDRVARHLQPIIGLNATLNNYAAAGVAGHRDPSRPPWAQQYHANWASTYNSLWTEFLWMYYDGPGANPRCTSSTPSYCWEHRRNVLASLGAPRVMGAAGSPSGDATLYLGYDTHDTTFTFRWKSEAPYFPGGRLPQP